MDRSAVQSIPSLALAALLTLAGCASLESPSGSADVFTLDRPALKCASPEAVRRIKAADNLTALRTETLSLFGRCDQEISERIPGEVASTLSADEKLVIFTAILSHLSAPYGPSTDTDPLSLLHAPTLHCGSYALLAGQLYQNAGNSESGDLIFVGLFGGAVGNHAQIIFKTPRRSMLLDPTVGLVAFTSFDRLLAGKAVKSKNILSFYSQGTELAGYNDTVRKAVETGLYRPSDLLYYYVGVDHYKDILVSMYTTTDPRATTGGYATPGAAAAVRSVSAYFFSPKEFRSTRAMEDLCNAVQKDKFTLARVACTASADSGSRINDWLNGLLQVGNIYDLWKTVHPEISLPEQGTKLVAATKDYRHKNPKGLTPEQAENVILLNRLIFEQTFPELCPKHRVGLL